MSGDFPGHVFGLSWGVPPIMEEFGDEIWHGDVIMMNDPYVAGTHLNDVMFYAPYFADGKLIMIIGVLAHWQDIGGSTPGLSGKSSHILEEGIRVPPIKIVEKGKKNKAVWNLLFANMRFPREQSGDALAMIDTVHIADVRLSELCAKYGRDAIESCRDAILDQGEQLMRQRISQLPEGEYYHENYLDNSGVSPEPVPIRVRLKIEGDSMTFDFTGTSPQTCGATNAGPSIAPVGAFFVIKSWLDPDTPINGGALRPIKFILPESSIVAAKYPAAVGGCWEVKNGVLGAVLGVFAQFMGEQAIGGESSGGCHSIIAGSNPVSGAPFLLYEAPFGGFPATSRTDGATGCAAYDHGEDFRLIHSAEVLEAGRPLLADGVEVRTDGESAGYRRSAFGIVRRVKVLSDATLSVNGGRFVIPPFGVAGACPGSCHSWTVLRAGKQIVPSGLPGCSGSRSVAASSPISMATPAA